MARTGSLLCVVVLAVLAAACGESPVAPDSASALTERVETASYVFRFASGDSVDMAWQEAYHAWAIKELGLASVPRITYNKYRSRQHMGEVVGVSNTNAYADVAAYAIHTIWPTDNHEVVHLYSSAWGSPVALFSEGLAVAYSTNPPAGQLVPRWHSEPVHTIAARFRAQGTLIPIARLAETRGFRSFDPNVTYPEAGSFVRFLVDRWGLAPMRQIYAGPSCQRLRGPDRARGHGRVRPVPVRTRSRVARLSERQRLR
jgi:hypothetical protein